jgi:subtilisin family serine protease
MRTFGGETFVGEGEIVVIIDDGHAGGPDPALAFAWDFSGEDDPDARAPRPDSHGALVTQVALGVAPGARIVHLKVFPDDGGPARLQDVEEALRWVVAALTRGPIAAVNLSLGFGVARAPVPTSLSDELRALDEAGVLVAVAAGNAGGEHPEGVNVLAADPGAVAVSAVDAGGAFAAFSQRSPTLTGLAALGEDVPARSASGAEVWVSGTSFAAPYVAGAAALLQDAAERLLGARLTDEAALELLRRTGTPVRDAPEAPGYRIADAEAALRALLEAAAPPAEPVSPALSAGADEGARRAGPTRLGDRLLGDEGDDRIDALDGDDVVKSFGGDDAIDLGPGDDVALSGSGDDLVIGGDGDDVVKPGPGDDVVIGGAGDDVVAGFRGDERFEGGEGNDRLLGSVGDDTLIGGEGDDRLWGGPGYDAFVFETLDFGHDTLPLDFRIGSDTLDFTAVDGLSRSDFSIRQVGANVVLEVGEGSLVMNGARFGGLDADELIDRFDEVVLL